MTKGPSTPDGLPDFLETVAGVERPPVLDIQDFRTCTRLPKPAWKQVKGSRKGAIRLGESWIAPVRWSAVANQNGTKMHTRATWEEVCGPTDESGNAIDPAAQGWAWPPGNLNWYAPEATYWLFNTLSSKNKTVQCGIWGIDPSKWGTYHVLNVGNQECAMYAGPIWSVRNWLANDQPRNANLEPRAFWPATYHDPYESVPAQPRWLLINTGGDKDIFVFGSKTLQERLRHGLEAYEILGSPAKFEEGVAIDSRDDTPWPLAIAGALLTALLSR